MSKYKKQFNRKRSINSLLAISIVFITLLFSTHVTLHSIYLLSNPPITRAMTQLPNNVKRELKTKNYSKTLKIPILMYHYVEYVKDEKDTTRKSLNITPDIFEAQIKTLKDNNYMFLTMNDLTNIMEGRLKQPEKAVVITFDDGYEDFYTDVLPILKKYNAKAVQYLISGAINNPNYLKDNQIKEIIKSGLVEIGAHSITHNHIKDMPKFLAEREIKESKKALENKFYILITSFAYPYGSFDQQAIDLAKEAGYKNAVSTIPGIEESEQNKYFIYRIRPGQRIGDDLINYFSQKAFKPY